MSGAFKELKAIEYAGSGIQGGVSVQTPNYTDPLSDAFGVIQKTLDTVGRSVAKENDEEERKRLRQNARRMELEADTTSFNYMQERVDHYNKNPTDDYDSVVGEWDDHVKGQIDDITDVDQRLIYQEAYNRKRKMFLGSMMKETEGVRVQKAGEAFSENMLARFGMTNLPPEYYKQNVEELRQMALEDNLMTEKQFQSKLLKVAFSNIKDPEKRNTELYDYMKNNNLITFEGSDEVVANIEKFITDIKDEDSFTLFNGMALDIEKVGRRYSRDDLGVMVESGKLKESHYNQLLSLQSRLDNESKKKVDAVRTIDGANHISIAQYKKGDQTKLFDSWAENTITSNGTSAERILGQRIEVGTPEARALGNILEKSRSLNIGLGTQFENVLKGLTTSNQSAFKAAKRLYDNIATISSPDTANQYLDDKQQAYLMVYNLKVGQDSTPESEQQFFDDLRSNGYKEVSNVVSDYKTFRSNLYARAEQVTDAGMFSSTSNRQVVSAQFRDMAVSLMEVSGGTVSEDEAFDLAEKWVDQNYMPVDFGGDLGFIYLKTGGKQFSVGNNDYMDGDSIVDALDKWRGKNSDLLEKMPHYDPDMGLMLKADQVTATSNTYAVYYTNGVPATNKRVAIQDLYDVVRDDALNVKVKKRGNPKVNGKEQLPDFVWQ